MRYFCDYVSQCIYRVAQDNSSPSSGAQRRHKAGHSGTLWGGMLSFQLPAITAVPAAASFSATDDTHGGVCTRLSLGRPPLKTPVTPSAGLCPGHLLFFTDFGKQTVNCRCCWTPSHKHILVSLPSDTLRRRTQDQSVGLLGSQMALPLCLTVWGQET